MTASTSDFRSIILQNLKRRNRKCAQFERVFQSCESFKNFPPLKEADFHFRLITISDTALSDSLNYLVSQKSNLRKQKSGSERYEIL